MYIHSIIKGNSVGNPIICSTISGTSLKLQSTYLMCWCTGWQALTKRTGNAGEFTQMHLQASASVTCLWVVKVVWPTSPKSASHHLGGTSDAILPPEPICHFKVMTVRWEVFILSLCCCFFLFSLYCFVVCYGAHGDTIVPALERSRKHYHAGCMSSSTNALPMARIVCATPQS